jgi:hypothetical protein
MPVAATHVCNSLQGEAADARLQSWALSKNALMQDKLTLRSESAALRCDRSLSR